MWLYILCEFPAFITLILYCSPRLWLLPAVVPPPVTGSQRWRDCQEFWSCPPGAARNAALRSFFHRRVVQKLPRLQPRGSTIRHSCWSSETAYYWGQTWHAQVATDFWLVGWKSDGELWIGACWRCPCSAVSPTPWPSTNSRRSLVWGPATWTSASTTPRTTSRSAGSVPWWTAQWSVLPTAGSVTMQFALTTFHFEEYHTRRYMLFSQYFNFFYY